MSVFTASDGTVAAALVDLAGHDEGAPVLAERLAWAAAAIGARKGAVAGVLTAAALVAEPVPGAGPDGAVVVAVVCPGRDVEICVAGDAVAYGWDGRHLIARTVPQGVGERLHVSLATAVAPTVVPSGAPPEELLILLSDGADPGRDRLEALAREHTADPQALADALVAAAGPDTKGERDDATTLVISANRPVREFRRPAR
ncbi:SpoIIE family protein phosphatase [Streptomyces inusitatus]|uniref:SpoIIE family protein phosphatase n=1 Tax=Streptomyces inusitatus TaxID=68221 RepID=UPI00167EE8AA|nr:SpoIIE family protein phosphatase [Streptomyces inusitatus]